MVLNIRKAIAVLIGKSTQSVIPNGTHTNYWPKGKVMVCDRGRSADMRLYPDCTWEGGAKCSGLELHKYDPETCKRWFCVRASVWRQCENIER